MDTSRATKAWVRAARAIHGDFEKGFIWSEGVACDGCTEGNGEASAKEAGMFRVEGKTHAVTDSDVQHFPFIG